MQAANFWKTPIGPVTYEIKARHVIAPYEKKGHARKKTLLGLKVFEKVTKLFSYNMANV